MKVSFYWLTRELGPGSLNEVENIIFGFCLCCTVREHNCFEDKCYEVSAKLL